MEIERKFLINSLPSNIKEYNYHIIEQGYLCTEPVVRIRRQDEDFFLTYKSAGLMVREEYNLPLTLESYNHLLEKVDGNIISKKRYLIPLFQAGNNYTIELDVFSGKFQGLLIAEVEFENEEQANNFTPPSWFGADVTYSSAYHNSTLSRK